MSTEIKKKYNPNPLIFLLCLTYFVSYLTRKNYSVAVISIIESTSFAKSEMGIVESMLLITYGVGQIISGFLGDKFKPQNIILCGLIISSACNLVFPMFNSIVAFAIIWAVNGFAQALFWPPLVKIMADNMNSKQYRFACAQITTSSLVATIALYLIIPLVLSLLNWHWVFYLAAICGSLMIFVWQACYKPFVNKCNQADNGESVREITPAEPTAKKEKIKIAPIAIGCGIITILIGIALQGFLRDGITMWMPDLVTTFGFSANTSILMSVILPIFSIGINYLITFIYAKFFKSELTAAAVFFGISCLFLLLMYFINVFASESTVWAIISIVLAALSVGLMHGVNLMLIAYVPARFAKYNAVSFMSGLTNTFTYIGSAISAYLIPLMSSIFGWNITILTWLAISAVGAFACLMTIKRWGKFIKR